MASRKSEWTACGTRAVLILMLSFSACTRPPIPDQGLRYDISSYPEEYTQTRRVVGGTFATEFELEVTFIASEGRTIYAALGRSVEFNSPPDDPRPIVQLRIVGPKGAIERTFLFASGFPGSVFLPQEDVDALGLPGHATTTGVLLVREDEQQECQQVSLEVEFPALGLKRTIPVMWKPHGRE